MLISSTSIFAGSSETIGIITVYLGVVLAVGRLTRGALVGMAFRVQLEDMGERIGFITDLVEFIYEARMQIGLNDDGTVNDENKPDLVLEETLYEALINMLRIPEFLMRETGFYQHSFPPRQQDIRSLNDVESAVMPPLAPPSDPGSPPRTPPAASPTSPVQPPQSMTPWPDPSQEGQASPQGPERSPSSASERALSPVNRPLVDRSSAQRRWGTTRAAVRLGSPGRSSMDELMRLERRSVSSMDGAPLGRTDPTPQPVRAASSQTLRDDRKKAL